MPHEIVPFERSILGRQTMEGGHLIGQPGSGPAGLKEQYAHVRLGEIGGERSTTGSGAHDDVVVGWAVRGEARRGFAQREFSNPLRAYSASPVFTAEMSVIMSPELPGSRPLNIAIAAAMVSDA